MSLGKTIVRLRMQKTWKQKDLAEKLGVNQRQLVRWEHDQARPRLKALQRMAELFNVPIEELSESASPAPITDDPELQELLGHIPSLEPKQLEALKTILSDMVTKSRLEAVLRPSARKTA